jgi:hypothetical protein
MRNILTKARANLARAWLTALAAQSMPQLSDAAVCALGACGQWPSGGNRTRHFKRPDEKI